MLEYKELVKTITKLNSFLGVFVELVISDESDFEYDYWLDIKNNVIIETKLYDDTKIQYYFMKGKNGLFVKIKRKQATSSDYIEDCVIAYNQIVHKYDNNRNFVVCEHCGTTVDKTNLHIKNVGIIDDVTINLAVEVEKREKSIVEKVNIFTYEKAKEIFKGKTSITSFELIKQLPRNTYYDIKLLDFIHQLKEDNIKIAFYADKKEIYNYLYFIDLLNNQKLVFKFNKIIDDITAVEIEREI